MLPVGWKLLEVVQILFDLLQITLYLAYFFNRSSGCQKLLMTKTKSGKEQKNLNECECDAFFFFLVFFFGVHTFLVES